MAEAVVGAQACGLGMQTVMRMRQNGIGMKDSLGHGSGYMDMVRVMGVGLVHVG